MEGSQQAYRTQDLIGQQPQRWSGEPSLNIPDPTAVFSSSLSGMEVLEIIRVSFLHGARCPRPRLNTRTTGTSYNRRELDRGRRFHDFYDWSTGAGRWEEP